MWWQNSSQPPAFVGAKPAANVINRLGRLTYPWEFSMLSLSVNWEWPWNDTFGAWTFFNYHDSICTIYLYIRVYSPCMLLNLISSYPGLWAIKHVSWILKEAVSHDGFGVLLFEQRVSQQQCQCAGPRLAHHEDVTGPFAAEFTPQAPLPIVAMWRKSMTSFWILIYPDLPNLPKPQIHNETSRNRSMQPHRAPALRTSENDPSSKMLRVCGKKTPPKACSSSGLLWAWERFVEGKCGKKETDEEECIVMVRDNHPLFTRI